MSIEQQTTPARHRWLTPGVLGVGGASFFSDAGHEMVTALLPGFVTGTLGGGAGALAAIDGVADALTRLSKLAGGPLAADRRLRGRLARGGYIGTAIATAAIGVTTAVWQVAILRGFAWISRGLRSPPATWCSPTCPGATAWGGLSGSSGPATISARSWGRCWRPRWWGARGPMDDAARADSGLLAAAAITVAVREAERR